MDAFSRDVTCIPARAAFNGVWSVELGGKRVHCPALINRIYDGKEVLAAVRRSDVSLGGEVGAKVLGVIDDGKGRFLRLGVPGGIIYCNGIADVGQEVGVTIRQAAFIFDPSSGYATTSLGLKQNHSKISTPKLAPCGSQRNKSESGGKALSRQMTIALLWHHTKAQSVL